jgi:hypothetical protein
MLKLKSSLCLVKKKRLLFLAAVTFFFLLYYKKFRFHDLIFNEYA